MELAAPYSLSRRVPSATRPPLRKAGHVVGPPKGTSVKASRGRSRRRGMGSHLDAKRSNPSDAVLAVSRLLSPGAPADPARVQAAVAEHAARFFGAQAALLIGLEDADRTARVVVAHGATPTAERHDTADLAALEDFVASRAPRAHVDATVLAPLAPELTQHPDALLVAIGPDVLVLAGPEPTDHGALVEVFVNTSAAALERVRTAALHEVSMT